MWLFTTSGFVSVVQHQDTRNILVVRARVRADLEFFAGRIKRLPARRPSIQLTPDRDYRFRMHVWRHDFAYVVAHLVAEIGYPNFKERVGTADRQRALAYHEVWDSMRRLQILKSGKRPGINARVKRS